ncbi:tRNA isopentenyl-2-thiomethyl-A-37 hydroxylase MiaE [Rheinheimera tilapiae]|jgi:tRNA-(ms[2]io[6]A)-hydroxylase|uniref:tRNA isopentenyl-2-thiomethyl-A-37 hydroxylase MiaE n=1 Tax=Rheinheimera tilapiae TaxID=875043 RepID=A0ABV6BJX0_9GAMM
MNYPDLLAPIHQFLLCPTPQAWIKKAQQPEQLAVLLQDHLLCELKAAQTAMLLLRKYAVDKTGSIALLEWLKPFEDFAYRFIGDAASLRNSVKLSRDLVGRPDVPYSDDIIGKMVLLIREELHHFYQVLEIMQARDIPYSNISAGRYAKGLISACKTHEPQILVDKLICGALIEARSCERFAALADVVDTELSQFYLSLLRSEARHFDDYLTLARQISKTDITPRVQHFLRIEADLIQSPDQDFKFHSGLPV